MASEGLTIDQKRQYADDGFTVLRGLFTPAECDAVIDHMMAVHDGRLKIEGYEPKPDDWSRWFNPHLVDPFALDLLLHPKLRKPLEDCVKGKVDAIQTMYFCKGSEQSRHQDQYYLPTCFSAWMAMVDVGPDNGTIYVQRGSNNGKLITRDDLCLPNGDYSPLFGKHYDDAVQAVFEKNALEEVPVEVSKGDVVLFDGVLIHRGGPINKPHSFRHVMANHYIPHSYEGLNYEGYPRISFDGIRRLTVKRPA